MPAKKEKGIFVSFFLPLDLEVEKAAGRQEASRLEESQVGLWEGPAACL